MKSNLPEYKEWKKQQVEMLSSKFHRKFGNKLQEYEDFCEKEYEKAQLRAVVCRTASGAGIEP